jgi:hypothetical protein
MKRKEGGFFYPGEYVQKRGLSNRAGQLCQITGRTLQALSTGYETIPWRYTRL